MSSSAFETAVRLLGGRPKSRARLAEALRAKGHAEADVTAAIERVTELGYLDDARHAATRARAGFAEGRSMADVQRRLESDGIDPAVAAAGVRAAAAEVGHDDAAAARALLKKRKLTGARAARLLASRGFPEELIEKLLGDAIDPQRDRG